MSSLIFNIHTMDFGELKAIPVESHNFKFPGNKIEICKVTKVSEIVPPLLMILISSARLVLKLETTSKQDMIGFYLNCLRCKNTMVASFGNEEIHLVAMPSRTGNEMFSYFWCFSVPVGLYDATLRMLNQRSLALVFGRIEGTLVVADTIYSFEDKIEALKNRGESNDQPQLLRRYVDDLMLLKQYAENDCVIYNGSVYRARFEEAYRISDDHPSTIISIVRPVITLPEKNLVLTRIDPQIRHTSVLVRLRPAWEDLRSYLTTEGQNSFEVYVCTEYEINFALEMWRLLDPEAHLISSNKLLSRVVCAKSGSRALVDVFQNGLCHPKMAMVIDNQLEVWDDEDKPQVYIIPSFTPYDDSEIRSHIPNSILLARNFICHVKGSFFRKFDEEIVQRSSHLYYEDEPVNLPFALDVGKFLKDEFPLLSCLDAQFSLLSIRPCTTFNTSNTRMSRMKSETEKNYVEVEMEEQDR